MIDLAFKVVLSNPNRSSRHHHYRDHSSNPNPYLAICNGAPGIL